MEAQALSFMETVIQWLYSFTGQSHIGSKTNFLQNSIYPPSYNCRVGYGDLDLVVCVNSSRKNLNKQPDYSVVTSVGEQASGNEAMVLLAGELKSQTLHDAIRQLEENVLGPQCFIHFWSWFVHGKMFESNGLEF